LFKSISENSLLDTSSSSESEDVSALKLSKLFWTGISENAKYSHLIFANCYHENCFLFRNNADSPIVYFNCKNFWNHFKVEYVTL